MSATSWTASLKRLLDIVPPPPTPLEVERAPAMMMFDGGRPVRFPPDYLAVNEKYGSGWFDQDGDVGMIASIHNPRAAAFQTYLTRVHAFLREWKEEEGDGYAAYDIFPNTPGLLQWGWADGRHAYFWLTKGRPERWPLVVMWDFEFFAQYDMPVVVFLERLVRGKLDARFLADEKVPMYLDAARISFITHEMVPG